jgi:hypothetical protein
VRSGVGQSAHAAHPFTPISIFPRDETVSQLRCDSVIEGGGAASRATQYRDYAIELRFFS